MDREILDLKVLGHTVRRAKPIEPCTIYVNHLIALLADKVMVSLCFAVVTGGWPRVMQPPNNSQVDQRVEHAINGRSRDSGNSALYAVKNLIGCGMVVPFQDDFESDATLHR
jgi:hypothetical protein